MNGNARQDPGDKADLTTWSANKIRSFVFDGRWPLSYSLFIHL